MNKKLERKLKDDERIISTRKGIKRDPRRR